ncbi:hypothetical protein [Nocardioides sambongensis]|uniref:hypothetical protein n=1 Tax=Nocardioides sambongensis TaxID=2589074 RepID=UPI00112DF25C|nr:hypothetical protein [Nocardioides sambongensis]
MSVHGGVEQTGSTPPLPRSIWVVAWASLVVQVMILVRQGVRLDDEVSLVASVVIGALVVGYVSAGVVRARTVRLVVAWVVLLLGVAAGIAGLVSAGDPAEVVLSATSLAATGAAIGGLAAFHRTAWFDWQRTRPSTDEGARIGRLVAIGLLVGVLGGLIGPVDNGLDVRINVAGR